MSTVKKWKKANWNKLLPASLASDRKRINANNTACTTKTVPSCLNIPEDAKETFPIHRHKMHRDLSTVDWSQWNGGNRFANVEHLHVLKRNGDCGRFRGPEIQNVHLSSESFLSDN
ncbi:hypothetical protein T01_7801 [Trichinella spiralis]|uniref:Uncharacterized protein n=1 Tax=Trichinella spiralis TaxID=6334 RepID=A0A0V1BKX1_TRISP|nr:hypothetical protein T01_7801 [Trichinella spiralis]